MATGCWHRRCSLAQSMSTSIGVGPERETRNAQRATRLSLLDVLALDPPPRLIVNPRAGHKLGMSPTTATLEAVEAALNEAGLHVGIEKTRGPRHATELARQAVRRGC